MQERKSLEIQGTLCISGETETIRSSPCYTFSIYMNCVMQNEFVCQVCNDKEQAPRSPPDQFLIKEALRDQNA